MDTEQNKKLVYKIIHRLSFKNSITLERFPYPVFPPITPDGSTISQLPWANFPLSTPYPKGHSPGGAVVSLFKQYLQK